VPLKSRFDFKTVLLALAAIVWIPSCGRESAVESGGLIVLVMDTVRADHLSCYGYERRTSPQLEAIASAATLYERAIAPGSWTVPSHASMFTGKHVFEHGAHRIEKIQSALHDNVNPLDRDHFTLAEAFDSLGYKTAAFVANDGYLSRRWQLDQGFQTYKVHGVRAPELNDHVFAWLDTLVTDRFFLFVNYMDAHNPYNTTERPGLLDKPLNKDKTLRNYLAALVRRSDSSSFDEGTMAQKVIDQYDTGIANLDESIGVLIDSLRARGLYEQTTIVIASDHGENFGEHDYVGHGLDVYQAEVWVPLIVKAPGQQQAVRNADPISLVDLPRLVFSLMGDGPFEKFYDDFPNAPGNHPVIAESYFSSTEIVRISGYADRFKRVRTAIIDWPHKYIDATNRDFELYDVEEDPKEVRDLLSANPDTADRLSEILFLFQESRDRANKIIDQPPLTAEELDKLRALGYIGK
jgi:arylsulfatase A-like enzyme